MLRPVSLLLICCLPVAGCFPTQAPERLPVHKTVTAAASAEESYHLDLSGAGLKAIPADLTSLRGMAKLTLRGSSLGSLPVGLGDLSDLPWLDMGNAGVSALPADIGRMKTLTTLYLSDNKLKTLPGGIGELENLNYLNLDRNQL